jgi:cbb3-type cytochrome oxidase maturation protein
MGWPAGSGYERRKSFQVLYDKNHIHPEFISYFGLKSLNTFEPLNSFSVSVLILLLIASLSVSVIFLVAFIWSTKNKQFEDPFSSSMRILFEDKPVPKEEIKDDPLSIPSVSKYNDSDNPSHRLN